MGKPYAGFDEAGAGKGLTEYLASPRPYLWGGWSGNHRLYPEAATAELRQTTAAELFVIEQKHRHFSRC